MRFVYQEWDGSEFPSQKHLEYFSNFMDYLLEHGEAAVEALRELAEDPEHKELLEQWIKDGLIEKVGVRFRLTPRAITSIQRKALMEVFSRLQADSTEGHETPNPGTGGERMDGTRPYQFGDPASEVDLNATLRNAVKSSGLGVPIRFHERDLELYTTESKATCSTVILLDMSGSMSRWQRFAQAKKCAMAIYALIKQRFILDTVDVVGFHSGAGPIPEHKLALAMPKRISTYDPQIRMRVAIKDLADAPQHFTNLHMGLMTARKILRRRGGRNKQVFIITDGQPTAHVEGDHVYLLYPPDEATALATLSEAVLIAREGVRFSTFALVEDYYYMDWINFVDQLTRCTKGTAFYCTSGNLSSCVMESFLSGHKTKAFLV